MKEVQGELRTAYMTALDALVVDSVAIPVYDEDAPLVSPDHFIIITNQTDNELPVKQAFYNDCSITVDITTSFSPGKGGKEFSERIANEVLKIVKPEAGNIAMGPDFQIVTTTKTLTQNLNENLPTRRVCRKILVFRHKIKQLTND